MDIEVAGVGEWQHGRRPEMRVYRRRPYHSRRRACSLLDEEEGSKQSEMGHARLHLEQVAL